MKTKLLAPLFILMIVSTAAMAQPHLPFLQVGIKGGVNVTKIDGKSFSDEFMYGYHLGGFAQIKLGDKFQLQPEVLFNQYTTKVDTTFRSVIDIKNLKGVKLNYVSIPLLLNFTPTKFFTLQAGPQFGILMDKHKNLFENGKDAFKAGDLSLLGGVQLNISNFRISGRYFIGLADINDAGNQDKWKNQGFQLSLGLRII
jgi:Outer membrane protein beta-barrel domain